MNFNLIISAVLEKELYTTPPLMAVIVAKVNGSREIIPKAFRLTKDLSTVDLKHLRRIRDLPDNGGIECIICKVRATSESDQTSEMDRLKERLATENIFKDYRIAQVPSSAPRTEHQLKACMEIWPCKFAKSNYLIQCIEGSLFSEAEKMVLRIIVNNVLEHIKRGNSTDDDKVASTAAAVVFRCARIHGIGFSSLEDLKQNPVKHSAMMSIDSVATNAGSGHWKSGYGNELLETIQNQLDSQTELKDHRVDAHFLPYLCTNYDIFVTEEPCFMCTMGLVQSRIRRLFYLDSESINKLTDCQRLCYPDRAIENFLVHRDRNLNHRFEAWRITLTSPETTTDTSDFII